MHKIDFKKQDVQILIFFLICDRFLVVFLMCLFKTKRTKKNKNKNVKIIKNIGHSSKIKDHLCPACQAPVNSAAQPGAATTCAQQARHPLIQHTAWSGHHLCPAGHAPVNSAARPGAIRFRSGSFLASTWIQLGVNLIRFWIRFWEESPKETGSAHGPTVVRRTPQWTSLKPFFNLY